MPEEPEPILPPDLFVCPITWSLDDDIRAATEEEPAPPGGPDGKAYVPTSLRLSSGLGTCFSGIWPPRQAANPLTPQGTVVCHGLHLMSSTRGSLFCAATGPIWACKLIPLKNLPTALETVEALFSNVFRHFVIPEDIMSERGPQFISRVLRGFFKLLGVSVSLSSGYHPQTNGQTERKIQEIGRYLRAYCHDHQHDLSQYLPWAEYAQISLRQESTKLMLFQCILGYQSPLFPWSAEPSNVPTVDHWFRESERVWESAHVHLQRAVRCRKVQADVRRCDAPLYHTVVQLKDRSRAYPRNVGQEARMLVTYRMLDASFLLWSLAI
ncbi:hypothetical protein QTP70_010252 [Hemibagrus guttatus]|uniref:Integrase catalytic domain-containing protein n=1 Tax=Hemibagrus guttatus TaxID=175788 RepID=A0AAE0R2K9_9TELE|nr:hypothetical protein QTP70_010252 [Hemibagrus guttatus]